MTTTQLPDLPTWDEPDYDLLTYSDLVDFAAFDPCPRMSEFFQELGMEEIELSYDDPQELCMPFEELIEWLQRPEILDMTPVLKPKVNMAPPSPRVAAGPQTAQVRIAKAAKNILRSFVTIKLPLSSKH